jgi:uncharacterized protein YjbJ (UPF0337 family)
VGDDGWESDMTAGDKPKHLVEEVLGKVKQEWGHYTGNDALEVEGEAEAEEAKAELEHDREQKEAK